MSDGQVSPQMITKAADYVLARTCVRPTVGLILGSGLSELADGVADADSIAYAEIPHLPRSTVAGHAGRFLLGSYEGLSVCLMQGRIHYYEGYTAAQITLPIRIMQQLGVRTLVVTNAAGGLRPDMTPGDLMAITDHINLVGMTGQHPLRGPNDDSLGPRFPGMTRAYDPALLDMLRQEAADRNVPLKEGVYITVAGPSFETPAEVRMLRLLGADAVGMSTAPEVTVARHAGMRVLGVSLISNVAIDNNDVATSNMATHEEVLAAGQIAAPRLGRLLAGVLSRLANQPGD